MATDTRSSRIKGASARASDLAEEIRDVLRKLTRRLREQADSGDLTSSQRSVISLLDREGPMTVTGLARAEGVRPQSMGATVSSLESTGMVSGAPDPSDGRQTIMSLTTACRTWIEAGRAARQDWLSQAIEAKLGAGEQEDLARALHLLKRLVET